MQLLSNSFKASNTIILLNRFGIFRSNTNNIPESFNNHTPFIEHQQLPIYTNILEQTIKLCFIIYLFSFHLYYIHYHSSNFTHMSYLLFQLVAPCLDIDDRAIRIAKFARCLHFISILFHKLH